MWTTQYFYDIKYNQHVEQLNYGQQPQAEPVVNAAAAPAEQGVTPD